MSVFINEVKTGTVYTEADDLLQVEKAMINQGNTLNITYDVNSNKYTFSSGNASASLYSTNDLLEYFFGENISNVKKDNFLVIINSNAGYDTIVYRGTVIGFGANESVQSAQNAFLDGLNSFVEVAIDVLCEYGANSLYDINLGLGTTFVSGTVGFDFIENISKTNDGISINQAALIDAFSSGMGFDNYIKGKASELVISDYSEMFLSYGATIKLSSISAQARQGELYNLTTFDNNITITLSDGRKVTYDKWIEWLDETGNLYGAEFSAGFIPENAIPYSEIDILACEVKEFYGIDEIAKNTDNLIIDSSFDIAPSGKIILGTSNNETLQNLDKVKVPLTIKGFDGHDILSGKAEYDLISAQILLDNIIFAIENSVVM